MSSSQAAVPVPNTDGRLPVWRIVSLCIINVNESLQGNIVWPILAYAVQRWGATDDTVALHVGLLASSFFLAQFLFVAAWGKAADTFGRRPTLLIGLFGTALSMTLFGFARSFPVAIAARFLTGALNGNIAIAKTYMGEITNTATQARAFAWLAFTWGLGAILAPALGGWLSEPAENYPALFGDSDFLKTFPYVLPALLSAAFSVAAFVVGYFNLPETSAFLARKRAMAAAHQRVAASEDEAAHIVVGGEECDTGTIDALERMGDDGLQAIARRRSHSSRGHGEPSATRIDSHAGAQPPLQQSRAATLQDTVVADGSGPSTLPREPPPPPASQRVVALVTLWSVVRDRAVMASISLYALLSFAQILFDELLPVLCKTSVEHGGFGFPSNRVGTLQLIAGATQITMQLLVIPYVIPRFGPIHCFRYAMFPLCALILFPAVARIADRPELLWPALAGGIVVKTSMMSLSFTSVMLLINNSSRGQGLGLINGFAQGAASGVRTAGPSVGGALFSASLSWMWLGGLRMHTVYALQTLAIVTAAVCTLALPSWADAAPQYDAGAAEEHQVARDATVVAPGQGEAGQASRASSKQA